MRSIIPSPTLEKEKTNALDPNKKCLNYSEANFENPEKDSLTDDVLNLQELVNVQKELYNRVYEYEQRLRCSLSNADHRVNDVLHYMEFYSLDACRGFQAYKLLRNELLKRRQIKLLLSKVTCFLSAEFSDFSGKMEQRLDALEHRTYTPRVLNGLFEGMEQCTKKSEFENNKN